MKSIEEFRQAGQELYDGLNKGLFQGIGKYKEQSTFWWRGEDIEAVVSGIKPPYDYTMNSREFLEALGMGIAKSRNERLAPIFVDEVDVLIGTMLLPLRKKLAEDSMTRAITETGRSRRNSRPGGLFIAHLEPCVDAVAAEEKARDTAFYIEIQYARYEELATRLELTEVQA